MKMKNNYKLRTVLYGSSFLKDKRLQRRLRKAAILPALFLLLNNLLRAQSCSITLTRTPGSYICAGAQATISASTSGVNLGNGSNGSTNINNTAYTDNTRSAVNGTNNAGVNKIRVWSSSGFSAGNEVLIITMTDASASGNLVGRYEFKTISSVSGDTLLLTQALSNSYVASSSMKHQVIKVPQYTNVTVTNGGLLTCNAWNGITGGVLCFRASGTVNVNNGGQISADGKGYRGISHAATYAQYNGAQGEGIYGQGYTGAASNGSNGSWNNANGNGGGGGTGTQDAAGGGGGSYGTSGAGPANYGSHNAGLAGNTVGNPSLTLLFFGGAGGEGGADEDGSAPGGGGNGGGIIFISAGAVSVNGLISSNGANGGNGINIGSGSGCGMAGGGGGAGGSIYISTNSISGSGSAFLVNGGLGGTNNGCGGLGGNGGSGRIRIDAPGTVPSTSPSAYAGSIPSLTGITYLWSNGSTASSIVVSPSVTTIYSVSITSTTGCTGTSASSTININPLPVLSISGNTAICAGGSLTLTANGASNYSWSTGSTAGAISLTPTANSSYALNGTSAAGCAGLAIASNVTVNPNPTLTVNSGSICNGSSFTISPSGASSYSFQGGNAVVTPGSSTSYTVTGASASGCTGNMVTSNVTVNALPSLTVTGTYSICAGKTATLTASGASNYTWSNGALTNTIVVSPSVNTTYSVTGSNASGCQASSTGSISVYAVPVVSISGNSVICSGDNAILNAAGASGYIWSNGATTASVLASPLNTTTYSLTGISSSGCVGVATPYTLTVNPLPVVSINGSNTVCAGSSVTLTASGANSYLWNNNSNASVFIVTPTVNSSYSVTGFDSNGCQANATVNLTVNNIPTVTISGTTAVCAGSSATLNASGADTYVWSNGSTTASLVVAPGVLTSYSVSGTSAAGCVGNSSLKTVSVNALPVISLNGNSSICSGNSSTLTASGGNSYVWSNGATTSSLVVSPLSNSSYSASGTNSLGCIGNSSPFAVTINSLPAVSISGTNAICAGAQASLTASGATTYSWSTGSTNTLLVVSPASTSSYTLTGISAAGCQSNVVRSVSVNALPVVTITGTTAVCAGNSATLIANGASSYIWSNGATSTSVVVSPSVSTNYSVIGTNSSGCMGNSTLTNVSLNPLPVVIVSGASVICSGNTTTLTASGAASYSWNNGATTASVALSPSVTTVYSVTGSSGSGCVGSASPLTVTVNALPVISISGANTLCAGSTASLTASGANSYLWNTGASNSSIAVTPSLTITYTVTGTNAAGCQNNALKTVSVNPLPLLTISGNTNVCYGSTSNLSANGASTYTWSNAAGNASISVSPTISTTYSVIGASTAGCLGSAATTVTVNPLPVVSVAGNSAICFGSTASLTAFGASAYLWSNGSTNASVAVSPGVNTSYSVSGTSAAGCVGNSTVFVLTVNPLPVISISGNNMVCAGSPVTLGASGANTYSWSNGSTTPGLAITPSANTSYSVTGTDNKGCQNSAVASVTVNALPMVSISGNNILCAGDSTQLTASGAISYHWSNGAGSLSIVTKPQNSTVYVVTGTDGKGCSSSDSTMITVNTLPVLSISGIRSLCLGDSTLLTASGAGTYTWSNGSSATSIMVHPLANCNYSVSGTSAAGCSGNTASTNVTVNPLPSVSISGNTLVCSGSVSSLTATGAITYSWSNGDSTATSVVNPLQNTNYVVSGTNVFGCKGSASLAVSVNALPVLTVQATSIQLCSGETASINVSGANSYSWSNGQNGNSIIVTPSLTSQYLVGGSDTLGCSSTASITLQVSDCTGFAQQPAGIKNIRVYPNPNNGNFVIALNGNNATSISIVNALGETVLIQNAENVNHIDLKALNNGIYFVRVIENNHYVHTTAVIKQ